jgi:RsmE family RNA methyltransferase
LPLRSQASEFYRVNVLLFADNQRAGDRFLLSPAQTQHVHTVLKAKNGDRLRIGAINGFLGQGILLDNESVQIEDLSTPPPKKIDVDIILALPRPKNLRRCVRALANYGVQNIHIVHSYRVEKAYWQSPLLETPVMHQALLDGLEIAGDSVLPNLQFHRYFKPFVEDFATKLQHERKLVTAKDGANDWQQLRASRSTIVAIGPEGGFLPYETELFQANGFESINLGARILSVENALSAVCAFAL